MNETRPVYERCPMYGVECEYITIARAAAEIATRYDDALKRMNDMQAELEYLRQEVNRG